MKKRIIIITILLIFIIVILIGLIINKKDNDNENEIFTDKNITLIQDEIDVYKEVYLKDLIKLNDNYELINDHLVDTSKIGNKTIEVEYYDKTLDKNKKMNINIKIVDKVAPYISIGKTYSHIINTNFTIDKDIICADNYDKSVKCELIGDYNLNVLGEQTVKYIATDSSNNKTEKEFILKVVERPIPDNSVIKVEDIDIPSNANLLIDVSKWQKEINWKKIKDSGVNYAMIRLGTQKRVDEGSIIDEYFERNIKEAKKNGIKVGVYYFSYANDINDAKEQANWVIEQLKGYELDLPVSFDWECWNLFSSFNLSLHDLNEIGNTFLKTIKDEGYDVMNYGSKKYLEDIWNLDDYNIWLAHYTDKTNFTKNYLMWQFTSQGKINGIENKVDLNFYYGS